MASAGTVESFVQSSSAGGGSGFESKSVLGGQALLQKLEGDLETLESHLVELNTYNERLTSEYNEKVNYGRAGYRAAVQSVFEPGGRTRSGRVRAAGNAPSFFFLFFLFFFRCASSVAPACLPASLRPSARG